ncbi:MAG: glycosyltransferase [Anaerolineales bacterium]|nr:glycosyltransferase [Anaerolineales bacterium]
MGDKKQMKVFLVEPRGSGGMIHYAYQMCTAMAKQGADVSLVTSSEYELEDFPHNFQVVKLMELWSRTDDPLSGQFRKNTVMKMIRGVRRGLRGIRWFIEWVRLTQYLLKTRPDVIHLEQHNSRWRDYFMPA